MAQILLNGAAVFLILHAIYNAHNLTARWRDKAALLYMAAASVCTVLAVVVMVMKGIGND